MNGRKLVHISKMQANVNQLEDAFDELDEDAAIVLDSCCTGQFYGSKQVDGIDLPCIARTVAEYAGGRIVFAPTKSVFSQSAQLRWNEGRAEVKFIQEKTTQYGSFFQKFIKNFGYYLLSYFGIKEDVTVKFKKYRSKS